MRNKYNSSSKNNEKEIQAKLEEVSKVKNELDDTKNQLSKAHQMISELSKKKPDNHHHGNSNFGKQAVVSDNSLNSQHFEVCVRKENKSFTFTVSPINDSCVMALNSQANYIKGENSIQINDMLFIGNVRLQIIDNYNKKNIMIHNGIIDVHVECQGRELQFKAKEIVSCSIKQQIEETMREMRNAENS